MVLQSTRKGNSVYDEMKERVHRQYLIDKQSAYINYSINSGLIEAMDTIEEEYNFNLFKLDELASLAHKAESLQRKFINQKFYIENMDVSSKTKIDSILTTACILNRFGNSVIDVPENIIYILSCVLLNTGIEEHDKYKMIIDQILVTFKREDESLEKTKQYTI